MEGLLRWILSRLSHGSTSSPTDAFLFSELLLYTSSLVSWYFDLPTFEQTILLSASTNKLSLIHEAENYATLIMEELDTENRGYIEVPFQFKTIGIRSLNTFELINIY